VAERARLEEQFREQASLLDKARDAILVRGLDQRITYWNKSAEALYGWTADEAVGQEASALLQTEPGVFAEARDSVLKTGEWVGELRQVNRAGGQVIVESRWTLVREADGEPKSILAINTDITERKKLEDHLLRAQRLESIGTLAGGIAHDLNNVLLPIMMSIDLLKLTVHDKAALATLATIETSARRGADMVQQVLSFARGVEGQKVSINPREVIEDIQKIIQDTFPKDIKLRTEMPVDLPGFLGDATQVHQVLLNLCVNARDAMPGGGRLDISASVVAVDENYAGMAEGMKTGAYVMIQVADSGSGIPPDVRDRIFDPFFTTKAVGKGTGLGLSTVAAIVKSQGGFITVYSEMGRGSSFKVHWPADAAPSTAAPAYDLVGSHPRGNGELVLVVDDEEAVRDITQQTLEAFGYQVLTANDGAEAVAVYAQHRKSVDVVLTDMMMPIMDGATTIEVLRRMNPDVKIIAASGLNANGGIARATAMGVKHFLTKPYTAQRVLTTLKLAAANVPNPA
ncbi:MAG TPA: response regulator, partial [Prosthecobacter sp.]|nr:response regulator [Prosthecobacter sp.]